MKGKGAGLVLEELGNMLSLLGRSNHRPVPHADLQAKHAMYKGGPQDWPISTVSLAYSEIQLRF